MATKKPIIPLSMKVRTATIGMDYQGSISQGLELLFFQLHGKPKTRAALLQKMQAEHEKMLAKEAAEEAPAANA